MEDVVEAAEMYEKKLVETKELIDILQIGSPLYLKLVIFSEAHSSFSQNASYILARQHRKAENNYSKMVQYYEKASKDGHVQATFEIGDIYFERGEFSCHRILRRPSTYSTRFVVIILPLDMVTIVWIFSFITVLAV